jgi:hypothetical protein
MRKIHGPDQSHREKIRISVGVNFVVEDRDEGLMPVIKTWKVKSGEFSCMYFIGKECK